MGFISLKVCILHCCRDSFLILSAFVTKKEIFFYQLWRICTDLQVSNTQRYNKVESPLCSKDLRILDKLGDMHKSLLIGGGKKKNLGYTDIKFLYCQQEACVIGKK